MLATSSVLKEQLEVTHIHQEPYFVDFLADPPEPTGEEADDEDMEAPKIYEQVREGVHVGGSSDNNVHRILI